MPLRVFPVASQGSPHFTDDFGPVRAGKPPHQGIDIFASKGAPILAPDDGGFEPREDPLGGHAFYLHAADGTYYGAHLDSYEGAARSVLAGDVLGYVGQSGNAAGTSPHLHFEWHPSGGVAVDPFRALSALKPQEAGNVHVEPPAPPPAADLPALAVVPGPVPPIPHEEGRDTESRGRRNLGIVTFLGGAFALSLWANRRTSSASSRTPFAYRVAAR